MAANLAEQGLFSLNLIYSFLVFLAKTLVRMH